MCSVFQADPRRAAAERAGGAHGDERRSLPLHHLVLAGRARHGHGHRLAAQLPGRRRRLPGGAAAGAAAQRHRAAAGARQRPAHPGPHRGRALRRCAPAAALARVLGA